MNKITTVALLLIVALLSCQKEVITNRDKKLELSEFATLFDIDKTYAIDGYTDTTGHDIAFNPDSERDNKYIFEATFADRNGRVYNTTKETLCFFHWEAYPHPDGWIVFEFVDFDLTPTHYRLVDYDVAQGYFKIKYGNTILTLKQNNKMKHNFNAGDHVTYWPAYKAKGEIGIVKRVREDNDEYVFVVYNCAGNWEHYQDYTAASSPVKDLFKGWHDTRTDAIQKNCDHEFRPTNAKWQSATQVSCIHCGLVQG